MGMDSVEIVMEIEDTFGISVPGKEWEQVRTVGELQDVVLKYLPVNRTSQCRSAFLFYRIRRSLERISGLERQQITPVLKLSPVFPKKNRSENWNLFSTELGMGLQELQKPLWIDQMNGVTVLCSIVLIWFFFSTFKPIYLIVVACMILLVSLINIATRSLKNRLPAKNLKELVRQLIVQDALQNGNRLNEEEVRRIILQILSERTGFDVKDIERHHVITDDLGVD